jgi:hypothetical protein
MTALRNTPPSSLHLMRRWVMDYFNRHDAAACADFIEPDYTLHIGDVVFAGRDTQWLPAVDQQMQRFPGLGMTVHQTLAGPDWAAAWFSEHGASQGRTACWSGVAIYRNNGQHLTSCVAQEDYFTRQRQLKSGVADLVDPPAAAPWDTPVLPRNEAAEAVVRAWLQQSWPIANAAVHCDDDAITGTPLQFDVKHCEVGTLLSSGDHVVFHVRQTGDYLGGLAGVSGPHPATHLHCNGMLHVVNGQVLSGRVIRDRMGLRARLLEN